MSVATEITRLQNAKSALKTAINAKNDVSHQIDDETIDDYATFVGDIQNGAYNIESVVEDDFQDLNMTDYDYTPTTTTPTASATATSGVTYTHILGRLTFAEINKYAKAISNASDIDNTTTDVYIDDGNNHYVLSVGDTICYVLSNDEIMVDSIIGFNHDDLTSSTAYGEATTTGKAGITFQMEDCFTTLYAMNDTYTNLGGWGASKMRTTTLPAIKLTMPSDLQSVIKMVNKKAANGGSSNYTETETLSDDLFLLSEIEVLGTATNSKEGSNEGSQYLGVIKDKVNSSKADYITFWWLRSCPYSNTTSFMILSRWYNHNYYNGMSYSYSSDSALGLSFAYCI